MWAEETDPQAVLQYSLGIFFFYSGKASDRLVAVLLPSPNFTYKSACPDCLTFVHLFQAHNLLCDPCCFPALSCPLNNALKSN